MVKNKLLLVILLCIVAYFIIDMSREVAKPIIQNGVSEVTDKQANIIEPLTDEDFAIKDENNYIELGGKYRDLKTNERIIETYEPNEHRVYYIYVYENFKISSGGDSIDWISLETPILKTSRGIKIGDSISKVFENYGKTEYTETSKTTGYYMYHYKGKIITFFIDKSSKVDGIHIELV